MKFMGDYHVHTVCSDGRGTFAQMAKVACERGLTQLGFAEHGPRNIGTGVKCEEVLLSIKQKMLEMQPDFPQIQLLTGVEADIISLNGSLDISREVIRELDYLIAGLHPYILPSGMKAAGWILRNQATKWAPAIRKRVKNDNTKALINAVYSYDIWAVSHPGLKMEIEIEEAARACAARNTAWEINTGHGFPSYRDVLSAARCGVDFVVNSDAHFPQTVGDLSYGSRVLEKAEVPVERIRNAVKEEEK